MAKTTRIIGGAALTATLVAAGPGAALAAQPAVVTLTVVVDDYVGVPPHVWRAAEAEATRLFRAAGVAVEWTHRRGAPTPAGTAKLTVVLLNDAPLDMTANSDAAVAGSAVRGSGRGYIYYRRVKLAANLHTRHPGTLLGQVITHELGHLLLPPNSHAFTGVMRADLNFMSPVTTGFIDAHAAAIRTPLSQPAAAAR